ncbi:hypothetical protein TrVE_jg3711 [Triparma verrucosa]|uniref:Peroxisomal ATPase PEX6 n=1 Tax=Triparma verrucosa TaxID=1606542 RepID=A0A9W7BZ25_9STRA|nr:hypothetical protein TrVE_jg3711 [Triparma verrucosa]
MSLFCASFAKPLCLEPSILTSATLTGATTSDLLKSSSSSLPKDVDPSAVCYVTLETLMELGLFEGDVAFVRGLDDESKLADADTIISSDSSDDDESKMFSYTPVHVLLNPSSSSPTSPASSSTAYLPDAILCSIGVHQHVRNYNVRKVKISQIHKTKPSDADADDGEPDKNPLLGRPEKADFVEISSHPDTVSKFVHLNVSTNRPKAEAADIHAALKEYFSSKRLINYNTVVRIDSVDSSRFFKLASASGAAIGTSTFAYEIHSDWCECAFVSAHRHSAGSKWKVGEAPKFLPPLSPAQSRPSEGERSVENAAASSKVEELSNLLLAPSPSMVCCASTSDVFALEDSLDEAASALGLRHLPLPSLSHYSFLYYDKTSDSPVYDKLTGLKAALQTAKSCAPCVVSIRTSGAESAEEEIIAGVAGMGGGVEALSMNSMQAQVLGMIEEEVRGEPKVRVVLMAVGDMKMSTEVLKDGCVSYLDFATTIEENEASREERNHALNIPNVKWEDIGGLDHVREEILDAVQLPMQHPALFKARGLRRSGILLFGPPGTGKTLVAKAVATEMSLPFMSVKGPELLDSYVGGSEANVRKVFDDARRAAKKGGGSSILFFDELDSLAPRRDGTGDSGGVMDRVVSMLLAELDGVGDGDSEGGSVFVIAATNRPDLLDSSLLRPGRFDRLVYLGLAEGDEARGAVLKALCRKFKFEGNRHLEDVVMEAIKFVPENLSGADLSAVASGASNFAMLRRVQEAEDEAKKKGVGVAEVLEGWSDERAECEVRVQDLIEASKGVVCSVDQKARERYAELREVFTNI